MKKILIVVLVVVLMMGVAGVAAGYFFVYRPAKAYIVSFAQLQEIPKLEAQVRNKASFTAPASGELTPERVERFVQTQDAVRQRLGARLDELGRKYQAFNQTGNDKRTPSVKEAFGALRDLTGLVVEAKRYQVEALNQNNFSISEYDWTRARVYEASGLPVDLTFQNAIREAASGKVPKFDPESSVAQAIKVPEKNRTLVAPHTKQLTDAAPLAFFGL